MHVVELHPLDHAQRPIGTAERPDRLHERIHVGHLGSEELVAVGTPPPPDVGVVEVAVRVAVSVAVTVAPVDVAVPVV